MDSSGDGELMLAAGHVLGNGELELDEPLGARFQLIDCLLDDLALALGPWRSAIVGIHLRPADQELAARNGGETPTNLRAMT
jgi:hypothetical protein